MSSPFRHPYTVGLHDTDAATILYSANLIRMCHQAYEVMMESLGFGIGRLIKEKPFGLPVVHIEGDFKKPLTVGDHVEIFVRFSEVGNSSVRTSYEVVKDGATCATASIVHACVDIKARSSMELPADFRAAVEKYR